MSKQVAKQRLQDTVKGLLRKQITPVEIPDRRFGRRRKEGVDISADERQRLIDEALQKFGVSEPESKPDAMYRSLLSYWKKLKRPPTLKEWSASVSRKRGETFSKAVRALCESGRIVRIDKGAWEGKYIPVNKP